MANSFIALKTRWWCKPNLLASVIERYVSTNKERQKRARLFKEAFHDANFRHGTVIWAANKLKVVIPDLPRFELPLAGLRKVKTYSYPLDVATTWRRNVLFNGTTICVSIGTWVALAVGQLTEEQWVAFGLSLVETSHRCWHFNRIMPFHIVLEPKSEDLARLHACEKTFDDIDGMTGVQTTILHVACTQWDGQTRSYAEFPPAISRGRSMAGKAARRPFGRSSQTSPLMKEML